MSIGYLTKFSLFILVLTFKWISSILKALEGSEKDRIAGMSINDVNINCD